MKRYRVVHMAWRNWPYWVQRRQWWWWEDVKDFSDKEAAIDRAIAYARGGDVVFDTDSTAQREPQ